MVELNRGLYLDEVTSERTKGFDEIAVLLGFILPSLAEETLTRGG